MELPGDTPFVEFERILRSIETFPVYVTTAGGALPGSKTCKAARDVSIGECLTWQFRTSAAAAAFPVEVIGIDASSLRFVYVQPAVDCEQLSRDEPSVGAWLQESINQNPEGIKVHVTSLVKTISIGELLATRFERGPMHKLRNSPFQGIFEVARVIALANVDGNGEVREDIKSELLRLLTPYGLHNEVNVKYQRRNHLPSSES